VDNGRSLAYSGALIPVGRLTASPVPNNPPAAARTARLLAAMAPSKTHGGRRGAPVRFYACLPCKSKEDPSEWSSGFFTFDQAGFILASNSSWASFRCLSLSLGLMATCLLSGRSITRP
jgi:hypothetical protein